MGMKKSSALGMMLMMGAMMEHQDYGMSMGMREDKPKTKKPKKKIIRWVTDAKHQVRIGLDLDETTYTVYELLKDGNLKKLWQF